MKRASPFQPNDVSMVRRSGGAVNSLWRWLLPELREFPLSEQSEALRLARRTELDTAELLGMAAGLVLVTALTRYLIPDADWTLRLGAAVLNYVVALPMLALCLGPFHLRRLRRGLREQLEQRAKP
jgi:hypothetical protein